MNTEKKQSDYEELMQYLEEAQAYETALILFEWDEETLAPEKAGSRTARMQGILSSSYQRIMMSDRVKELVDKCLEELTETEGIAPDGTQNRAEKPALETSDGELTEEGIRYAILKAAKRTIEEVSCIPPEEYRAYQELTSKSTRIWTKARQENDFASFAPVLKKIIDYQKKFASYRQKDGQRLYDVMLDSFEPGFTMEKLDEFFNMLKRHIVPLLKQVMESSVRIQGGFLPMETILRRSSGSWQNIWQSMWALIFPGESLRSVPIRLPRTCITGMCALPLITNPEWIPPHFP